MRFSEDLLLLGSLACLQHLEEEAEEHEGGDSGGDDIGDGLCQEYGKGLVLKEEKNDEDSELTESGDVLSDDIKLDVDDAPYADVTEVGVVEGVRNDSHLK